MDKSKLDTIRGTDTHSVFYVVGEKSDLVVGLRVWVGRSTEKHGNTLIGFRLRVQMRQGVSLTDNEDGKEFLKYVNQRFPLVQWNGGSKRHVSLSGEVHLSSKPTHHAAVLEQYAIHGIGNIVVKAMDDYLGGPTGVQWFLTPAEMKEFIFETVVADLLEKYAEEKHPDAVFINFCGINKKFIDGAEIAMDEGPSVADLVGLGDGDSSCGKDEPKSVVKGKITVPKGSQKHTPKLPQGEEDGKDNTTPTLGD